MWRDACAIGRAVAVHRAHDIVWPPAHLDVDASDIFADQAQREKDQPDEQEQDGEQRPQCAFLLRSVDYPMAQQDRREDRIESHVQLCWLALLLLRVAETETRDTWRNLRNELDRIHLVTLATSEGTVAQRTEMEMPALVIGHQVDRPLETNLVLAPESLLLYFAGRQCSADGGIEVLMHHFSIMI